MLVAIVRDRQPRQGHRRRGGAVDEPGAGLAGNRRTFDRGGGAVTERQLDAAGAHAGRHRAGGLPGHRHRGRDQGLGQAATSRWCSTRVPTTRPPGVHPQQGQGRAGAVDPAGADHRAAARGDPQLRRRQRLHRTRRLPGHPRHRGGASPPRCRTGAPRPAPSRSAVCSTGLIGDRLPMDKVLAGVSEIVHEMAGGLTGGDEAAQAIMTTDTVPKQVALHHRDNWTVGGMAKGAGMLAPSLATMLCVHHHRRGRRRRRAGPRAAPCHRAARSTGSTSTAAARPTTPCCCWPRAPARSRPARTNSTTRCCGSATTCAPSCRPTPRASPSGSPSR